MKQEYNIRGIEKIIDKVGKEKLARYYEVDIDEDFESIITQDFKKNNIPNGLEIAFYFSLNPEEFNEMMEQGRGLPNCQDVASQVYEQDGKKRAMFGFNYMVDKIEFDKENWGKMVDGTYGNVVYFYVDEPINIENVGGLLYRPKYNVGGVYYHGLMMGKAYYETHKAEIEGAYPDTSKIHAVDNYIENFMKKFKNVEVLGGYGPRNDYKETDKIKKENSENEKIILELTGKDDINELSLKDFISLKRKLEKEEQELKKIFKDKFTQKYEGERD